MKTPTNHHQVMNRWLQILIAIGLVAAGTFVHSVSADTWALPKKEKYYSPNKKYYLEVMPKKLESQLKYFEDKVEGRGNAGAQKKSERQPSQRCVLRSS